MRSGDPAPLNGSLDDVRIYNRALSAAEVASLYAARSTATPPASFMVYDARHARMMYCNGTNWVHMGTGSYNPNAVTFDGTNDYLNSTANLTGVADGKTVTGSFWFRRNGGTGTRQMIWTSNESATASDANSRFRIEFATDNRLQIVGRSVAPATVLDAKSSTAYTDTNWHHVLFSFDLTNSARRFIYIDGVARLNGTPSTHTNTDIDFSLSTPRHSVGARHNGTSKFNGDLAEFWLDIGSYHDLSAAANRAKFRSASGLPMYPGPDGSIPTGEAPGVLLSGDTANWHTNAGAGGGFAENGALTTAGSQPGNTIIPSVSDITSGLVGHWKFDETSGTVAADSSGNGNHLDVEGSAPWTAGKVGGGLYFNGASEGAEKLNPSDKLWIDSSFSVALWMKIDTFPSPEKSIFEIRSTTAQRYQYLNVLQGSPERVAGFTANSGGEGVIDNGVTDFQPGTWYHVAGIYNDGGNSLKFYVNGAETASLAETCVACAWPDPLGSIFFGYGAGLEGTVDDVRIYNRALAPEDVKALYACTAPPGAVAYDPDFNVMTYCNGAEWVAMGVIGGTPPTSGLVGQWKLDETSGTTAADSSGGGNNGTMQGGLDAGNDAVPGKVGNALDFDGTDDYVSVGAPAALNSLAALSASFWINPNSAGEDLGGGIIAKGDGAADANSWAIGIANGDYGPQNFGCNTNVANRIFFAKNNSATTADYASRCSTQNTVVYGSWQHYVVTWDGSAGNNGVRIYKDGTEISYADNSSNSGSIASESLTLQIGQRGGWNNFDGLIDDVRLYDRALSAMEVQQLYYYGLSGGLGDVSGNCANPSMPEGAMVYNADHSVMQYCNGEWWVGIGK